MSTLLVTHVVASLCPRQGGPPRTVVQLADALADSSEVDVTILTQGKTGKPVVGSANTHVSRCIQASSSRVALACGLPARTALNHMMRAKRPAIVHSHGLWLPVIHWAARAAWQHGLPLIMHPRGMIQPWALAQKSRKKRLAMRLYQRRDLNSASVLVAASAVEFESIRSLGLRNPVAVIPNGVKLELFRQRAPLAGSDSSIRTALFLSRVHPSKGLINLVRAWGALRPERWRLQIAGPSEGGHLDEVMAEVRRLNVSDIVEYVGEVDGSEKATLYSGSDLFVLPTYSENFGVVVAEAMAHALPVITTRGAPWADLEIHRCGWWVDLGVEALIVALRQAIGMSDCERRSMGERGRDYVRRYDWTGIARRTIDVYRWVLGQAPRPDFVQLE